MPLNLPPEIWFMFLGAGAFVVAPLILLYIAYRMLRPRVEVSQSRYDDG